MRENNSISFQAIDEAVKDFMLTNRGNPTVIIMHPAEAKKLIELLYNNYKNCAIHKLMNYRGLKLIRSYDVEEGNWLVR